MTLHEENIVNNIPIPELLKTINVRVFRLKHGVKYQKIQLKTLIEENLK